MRDEVTLTEGVLVALWSFALVLWLVGIPALAARAFLFGGPLR